MVHERESAAAGEESAAVRDESAAAREESAAVREEPAAAGDTGAPDSLEAGRVGRPHGLDGSFYVTRARSRLLAQGARVTLAGRALEIIRRAGVEQRPIVRLQGIDDRAAAEALRGRALSVPFAEAPALADGEWWTHQLTGCAVFDGERAVGTVVALLELPSCEVLEVRRLGGGDLLVPMVKDAVRGVDVSARRIEVDLDFLGER
jgi:16S rRNA processing protein RimM